MVESEEVFDLLADDYTREILVQANRKPMSALELAEACDAHHSTIYRRIEQLKAHDLVNDDLQIDSEGHHYTVYATTFESLTISLENESYHVEVRLKEDAVDRLAQMWSEIRREDL